MTKPPDFDIYPELDRQIADAVGQTPTDNTGGLQEIAQSVMPLPEEPEIWGDPDEETQEEEEVRLWAKAELESAIAGWQMYQGVLDDKYLPKSIAQVAAKNSSFLPTLTRLHSTRDLMWANPEYTTTDGEKVGEQMHLLLIPWQLMLDNLQDFEPMLARLRACQGLDADSFEKIITDAISQDEPMYRDYLQPAKMLTPSEYLEDKIRQGGPWGIMMVQTTRSGSGMEQVGTRDMQFKSADQLTDEGKAHLSIDKTWPGDSMGIFEWLAFTLQEDPGDIPTEGYSMLLANRISQNGNSEVMVPFGFRHKDEDKGEERIINAFNYTRSPVATMAPRLAVS